MAIIASSVDTAGSASTAVAMPSGIQQNDLLFIFLNNQGSGTFSVTPASGWTQIATDGGSTGTGSLNVFLYYKVAGASEPSTYTFTTTSGNSNYYAVRVANWNTNDTLSVLHTGNFTGSASTTTTPYTIPALTLTRTNDLIIGFFGQVGGNVTPTTSSFTWTQVANDTNSPPVTVSSSVVSSGTSFGITTVTPSAGFTHQANAGVIIAIQSFQNQPPPLILTGTVGLPIFRRVILAASFHLTAAVSAPTVSAIQSAVQNVAKHIAAVFNVPKS
jgi:hypothetical protein